MYARTKKRPTKVPLRLCAGSFTFGLISFILLLLMSCHTIQTLFEVDWKHTNCTLSIFVGDWYNLIKIETFIYMVFLVLWQLPSPCPQHSAEDWSSDNVSHDTAELHWPLAVCCHLSGSVSSARECWVDSKAEHAETLVSRGACIFTNGTNGINSVHKIQFIKHI